MVLCVYWKRNKTFYPKIEGNFPVERNSLQHIQGPRNKIWWKAIFWQICAIVWGKIVHVVIDMSLLLKGLKIFLNPKLSLLIVPLSFSRDTVNVLQNVIPPLSTTTVLNIHYHHFPRQEVPVSQALVTRRSCTNDANMFLCYIRFSFSRDEWTEVSPALAMHDITLDHLFSLISFCPFRVAVCFCLYGVLGVRDSRIWVGVFVGCGCAFLYFKYILKPKIPFRIFSVSRWW